MNWFDTTTNNGGQHEPKVVLGTVIAIPVKGGPSYEELVAENARLQARIGHLEEEISALRYGDRRQAVLNEQERCRREEVEPLWTAIGEMFSAAHRLSHTADSNAVDAVLVAADKAIRIRASVGEIQSRSASQPDSFAAERQRIIDEMVKPLMETEK